MDLCQSEYRTPKRLEVDLANPPRVVKVAGLDGREREHYLNWDQSTDDQGHLRRCPVCGCGELYAQKILPSLKGFTVVLLTCVALMSLYGFMWVAPALFWVMLGLLVLMGTYIGLYRLVPSRLICYQCRTRYYDLPIAPGQGPWSGPVAQRYRPAIAGPDNGGNLT